jgi:hypothetical protein
MFRKRTLLSSLVPLMLGGLILAGCQNTPSPPEVTVEVKSWDEVQQLVAELKGQVVVVDLWTSW